MAEDSGFPIETLRKMLSASMPGKHYEVNVLAKTHLPNKEQETRLGAHRVAGDGSSTDEYRWTSHWQLFSRCCTWKFCDSVQVNYLITLGKGSCVVLQSSARLAVIEFWISAFVLKILRLSIHFKHTPLETPTFRISWLARIVSTWISMSSHHSFGSEQRICMSGDTYI